MIELFEALRKLQFMLMHAVYPILQELGLNKTEVFVLMSVYHKRAARMTDFAKFLDVPASTFTGIIDRLVQKEYLERKSDPEDRRSVLLTGTPLLQEIVGNIMQQFEEKMKVILAPVPPDLVKDAIGNLNNIYDIIKADKKPCPHEN